MKTSQTRRSAKRLRLSAILLASAAVPLLLTACLLPGGHHRDRRDRRDDSSHSSDDRAWSVYYTCAMHPRVRRSEPGRCPECGMRLVQVREWDRNQSREDEWSSDRRDDRNYDNDHGQRRGN